MQGEAHYALANEWLARRMDRFAGEHPACRTLTIDWSVWSELGMGERLGRVEALKRQGIAPISPEAGVDLFLQLLRSSVPTRVVVTGRFGEPPTLALSDADLPALRFLEHKRVFYPGIELVVDATLSTESDPYLNDHVFEGEPLLPAVVGLEAMAQAAMALTNRSHPPVFEDVRFIRPVPILRGASVTIRLAALVRGPDKVEVVLRSEGTAFGADHFHAVCRFGEHGADANGQAARAGWLENSSQPVPLEPKRDLYGEILFQTGRFCRLRGYRALGAKTCVAEIEARGVEDWFYGAKSTQLVLGDPGARDAAVHAVQACIPHQTVLPIGVDRLERLGSADGGLHYVRAQERQHEGELFVYDLELADSDGRVFERWHGLRLKVVRGKSYDGPWPEALLGPYLERQIEPVVPGSAISIALLRGPAVARRDRSDRLMQETLANGSVVHRRADGRPETGNARGVSAAHAGSLTLAVAGRTPIGCDMEPVQSRSQTEWADLLGKAPFALAGQISREAGEDFDTAATRIWCALECMKKAELADGTPLVVRSARAGEPIVTAAGPFTITTVTASLRGEDRPLVIAIGATSNKRFYEYRHLVGFEETNLLGNVYYVNHLSWQGRCRELFLREHAPGVLRELEQGLSLVTTKCSCEYLAEVAPFDEIAVRMHLGNRTAQSFTLSFEYWRRKAGTEDLVARGEQEVACFQRKSGRLEPVTIPTSLREALRPYQDGAGLA
jgi:enediyne polyketide synthase